MERTRHGQPRDPDSDIYDEDDNRSRIAPYAFGRSARADHSRDSRPLFLSDPNGDPYPEEYINPLQLRRKWSISSRLLMATVVAAALAALYAFFASDASRDIVVNAKASIAAVMPGPSAAAQPDSTQLTPRDIQLKDAGRISPPAVVTTDNAKGVAIAAVNPTREAIATAYQGALQSQAPAPVAAPAAVPMAALPAVAAPTVAAPAVAAPPARQMDPDEFATLMQRAKALLAVGDISSARLLLERAAEAPDASAALMLAQTYDPQRLGASDVRSIVPEPAKARAWYQKAAQLGSADAQRRLAQLPN
jgi:TPR repeat protein